MNQVRLYSSTAARSYKTHGAPEFWRSGSKTWDRYYHRHSYGHWGWGPYHHHHGRRGFGFLGLMVAGTVGYWFGRHSDSEGWEKRHRDRWERFQKQKEEWAKQGWGNSSTYERQPMRPIEVTLNTNPSPEAHNNASAESSSSYGLWKS